MLPEYTHPERREEEAWSVEGCVRREENNLSWYVRNIEEALLRKVGDSNVDIISEAVDPKWMK